MSGSGISWAICKSAPRSRQDNHANNPPLSFYRPDALPSAQPTASKHWRQRLGCESTKNSQLSSTSTVTVIIIITQPVGWYSFYRPTKDGTLSRFWHCSTGAQPVPKAVYHSSCRDKHNHPWCDSNLGSLTPQLDALTTRPRWPGCFQCIYAVGLEYCSVPVTPRCCHHHFVWAATANFFLNLVRRRAVSD